MDRPLELSFHNMKASAEIDALVHERIARLEHLYPHIVGCRVSVELKNRPHRSGNEAEVHVELDVPGQLLVAKQKPHRDGEHYKARDASETIRDTFDVLATQLKEYSRKKSGDVKAHLGNDTGQTLLGE